jgi:phosphate transport system permease protein
VVTGVVLAVSRVIGETAPLLLAAATTSSVNTNLFGGHMMTLPVFIYSEYSTSTPEGYEHAWGGALVLIAIVMLLNLAARIIGKIFAPRTGR